MALDAVEVLAMRSCLVDNVVGLEEDSEPVRRDGIRDEEQDDDAPQVQIHRWHDEPVEHKEHLRKMKSIVTRGMRT